MLSTGCMYLIPLRCFYGFRIVVSKELQENDKQSEIRFQHSIRKNLKSAPEG